MPVFRATLTPGIGLPDRADPSAVVRKDARRLVRRPVVHDDDLGWGGRLGERAVDGLPSQVAARTSG